jgi:hypothetical protein
MSEVYRKFVKDWEDCLDLSDAALIEMYNAESFGGEVASNNGFYHGKKWLNVQVASWKDDLISLNNIRDNRKTLFINELYEEYPHWWLDSIFKETK